MCFGGGSGGTKPRTNKTFLKGGKGKPADCAQYCYSDENDDNQGIPTYSENIELPKTFRDDIKKQINDIIEGEIQNGINDYIEQEGRGFDGKLNVKVDQDEVDKLIKQYKKIKKAAKSNLGQVKKLEILDQYGNSLK